MKLKKIFETVKTTVDGKTVVIVKLELKGRKP